MCLIGWVLATLGVKDVVGEDGERFADVEQDAVEELQRIIGENRAQLSDVEKTVIQARFAINRGQDAPAMTLEEVGRVIGVTKERVRQIQNKALEKLRLTIESEVLVK